MNTDLKTKVEELIERGKTRGFVTYDELNIALPPDEVFPEDIEDVLGRLAGLEINVLENEDGVPSEPEAPPPEHENPLSNTERTFLLKSVNLAEEKNLLDTDRRSFIYSGANDDKLTAARLFSLSDALEELTPLIKLDAEDAEFADTLSTRIHYFRSEMRAIEGSEFAQNNCGDYWYFGLHEDEDYEKAAEWYRKAAEQGDANAQNNLGRAYAYGEGVKKDLKKAAEWYGLAAEQGNQDATKQLEKIGSLGSEIKPTS